jgi:putative transposase
LFAALDIATGAVFTECKPRHRHQEFLSFLRRLDAAIPEQLDVHLIVDNYATHKHSKVRTWLAQRQRRPMERRQRSLQRAARLAVDTVFRDTRGE